MTKKPRGETTIVPVRLTPAEHKKLATFAAAQGLGLSTWMRQLALNAANQVRT